MNLILRLKRAYNAFKNHKTEKYNFYSFANSWKRWQKLIFQNQGTTFLFWEYLCVYEKCDLLNSRLWYSSDIDDEGVVWVESAHVNPRGETIWYEI